MLTDNKESVWKLGCELDRNWNYPGPQGKIKGTRSTLQSRTHVVFLSVFTTKIAWSVDSRETGPSIYPTRTAQLRQAAHSRSMCRPLFHLMRKSTRILRGTTTRRRRGRKSGITSFVSWTLMTQDFKLRKISISLRTASHC